MSQQRTLTLFGAIEEDGSLKRVTFDQAYRLATDELPNTPLPETYLLTHDRAIRRFALDQMLPLDRSYFMHLAGVPVKENRYANEFASLCVDEVRDCMYAEDPNPTYFHNELERVMELMDAEPKARIPAIDELLLDSEIEIAAPID